MSPSEAEFLIEEQGKSREGKGFSASDITAVTAGVPSVELMKKEARDTEANSLKEAGGKIFPCLPGGRDHGFGAVEARCWK